MTPRVSDAADRVREPSTTGSRAIFTGVVLLALAAIASLVYLSSREHPWCETCRRPVHPETAFSFRLAEGGGRALGGETETWACCPRCGLVHALGSGKPFREVRATDYPTGRRVDATSCVYVVGSRIVPCCAPEVVVHEGKVACGRCFDACSPSVIAFGDPGLALEFATREGGEVVSYETLARGLGAAP